MQKSKTGQVRIIGGKWRGRKIYFPSIDTLRPTSDRIRETLFNWLAPYIVNASCVDLFAGSGVLGFESVSRGAKKVLMIDHSEVAIRSIEENVLRLESSEITVVQANLPFDLSFLQTEQFDIVFLDPPFRKNMITICSQWLEKIGCLKSGSLIYIEAEKNLLPLPIPENWDVIRSQKAGQVGYHLIRRL